MANLRDFGLRLAPYDGCAEIHTKDAAHFLQFVNDIHESKELVGE